MKRNPSDTSDTMLISNPSNRQAEITLSAIVDMAAWSDSEESEERELSYINQRVFEILKKHVTILPPKRVGMEEEAMKFLYRKQPQPRSTEVLPLDKTCVYLHDGEGRESLRRTQIRPEEKIWLIDFIYARFEADLGVVCPRLLPK